MVKCRWGMLRNRLHSGVNYGTFIHGVSIACIVPFVTIDDRR